MPYPVTFNGITYQVPVTGDVNWGPPLTRYLIALGTGALSIGGGLQTLTATLNLGPNFGVDALYFSSQSVNPAASGLLRLEKTDTVNWRNNANTGDLPLGINNLDQLEYNGVVIGSGGGVTSLNSLTGALSIIGTTNQVIVVPSGSNITLSTPQNIDSAASPTFAGMTLTGLTNSTAIVTNGADGLISSSTTATELSYVHGVTSSIQAQLNAITGGGLVTSITGTPNEVLVSSPTGNVTLSLPQAIAPSSTPEFTGVDLLGQNTITFIQGQQGSVTSGSSGTATITASTTGTLLAVCLNVFPNTVTVTSITDNVGNTYIQAAGAQGVGSGSTPSSDTWYCIGNTGGATAVTAHFSGTAIGSIISVAEFSNVGSFNSGGSVNAGSSSPQTGPALTAPSSNNLLIAMAAGATINATGVMSPWSTTATLYDAEAYYLPLSTGTYTAHFTPTTSDTFTATGAVFSPTAGIGEITIKAPSSVTSYDITFPPAQGSAGQTFQNDGAGNLSWITPHSSIIQIVASGTSVGDQANTVTTQSITTTGGKIVICATASFNVANASTTVTIAATRGGTAITGNTTEASAVPVSPLNISMGFVAVDTPAAGTYTYNFTWQDDNMSSTVAVNNYSFQLIELKQ